MGVGFWFGSVWGRELLAGYERWLGQEEETDLMRDFCETIHKMCCFGTEVKVCGVGEGGKGILDLFNQSSDLHWQVDK